MKSAISRSSATTDWVGGNFDGKYVPHKRMANVIIHCTQRYGNCSSRDLLPFGFSECEIAERWHMSSAMAAVELRLMANKDQCEARYA